MKKTSAKKRMKKEDTTQYVMPLEYGTRSGYATYQMSQEMANHLLSLRKGSDRNKDPQKYLCDVVNAEFNLMACCNKVVIV